MKKTILTLLISSACLCRGYGQTADYFQLNSPAAASSNTSEDVTTAGPATGYVGIGVASNPTDGPLSCILTVTDQRFSSNEPSMGAIMGVFNTIPTPTGSVPPSGNAPFSFVVLRSTSPVQSTTSTAILDFSVDNNGLVGIGAPGLEFGTAGAHLFITDPNPSGTLPLVAVGTNTGVPALYIGSNGQVGIGNVTPATGSALTVTGTATVSGSVIATGLQLLTSPAAGDLLQSDGSGNASWVNPSSLGIGGTSLWAASGSNIYNANTGNVGIGTSSPTANLTVASTSTTPGTIMNIVSGNSGSTAWANSFSINRTGTISIAGTSYPISATDFIVNNSGQVGIGTATPAYSLDVAGNMHVSDESVFSGTTTVDGSFQTNSQAYFTNGAYVTGGSLGVGTYEPAYPLDVRGSANVTGNTTVGGYVAIGDFSAVTTPFPTGVVSGGNTIPYALYVNGGVLAERYKCSLSSDATDWSDYVFDKDYKLSSLDQVKSYIEANHHLPDVPSTDDVLCDGIDLAKIDATLLKKIEELTLYMLQMKKENEQMKAEIANLKK